MNNECKLSNVGCVRMSEAKTRRHRYTVHIRAQSLLVKTKHLLGDDFKKACKFEYRNPNQILRFHQF